MAPRPRPLLGMTLGLLLGLVVVGLLWQLAIIDPGRTVLFGTVAIVTMLVAWLLTRDAAAARGRFTAVAVVAGMLGGVALTGIPELVSPGSISDGCTLEATVDGTTYTPASTAALTPLDVPPDSVVEWSATSETPVSIDERVAGVMIGGFAIPVRTVTSQGAPEAQDVSGEVDVAAGVSWIADRTWLEPSGVYHAYGTMSGGSVTCMVEGYIAVAPASAFATNTLVILWVSLAILLLLVLWAAIAVGRSFATARRARDDEARAAEVGTGTALSASELAALETPERGPVEHVAPAPAWTPSEGQPVVPAEEIAAPPAGRARAKDPGGDDAAPAGSDDTVRGARAGGAAPAAMAASGGDDAADGPAEEAAPETAGEAEPEAEPLLDEDLAGDEEAGMGEQELDAEPEDDADAAQEDESEQEPAEEADEPLDEPADAEGEVDDDGEGRIVPEDAEAVEDRAGDDEAGDDEAGDDEGPEPASEDEGSGPKPVSSV
ncbi:hypothetical protein [Demequina iriomotensis]|uniref:hypothetical protein n=1 Tax=Demequina iriomotensis TaxID=1536641 RepID=UPI000AFBC46B|nr:hypothetical protein [Demequina iriomotensis]